MTTDNYFIDLASVNVGEHTEKKGKFTYLSWPYAVSELKKRHPDASWEVKHFDHEGRCLPFMRYDQGAFVEVAVTVNGVTHSQIHPVLNGANRPIQNPDPFEVNTAIQRCLAKAIALHGLGLYIYAGEDLPEPPADLWKNPTTRKKYVVEIQRLWGANDPHGLRELWDELNQEQKLDIWQEFNSTQRSEIKKLLKQTETEDNREDEAA